jgi:hypothetical protein
MIEVPEALMYCNVIFAAIVFVVWTMKDPLNCLLKMMLFGLFVWNGFYVLQFLGYVVRLPQVRGG